MKRIVVLGLCAMNLVTGCTRKMSIAPNTEAMIPPPIIEAATETAPGKPSAELEMRSPEADIDVKQDATSEQTANIDHYSPEERDRQLQAGLITIDELPHEERTVERVSAVVITGVEELLHEGAIHSIDINNGIARIDPELWSMLVIERKESLVYMIRQYLAAYGRQPRILLIYSNRNNMLLATFSERTGIDIKQ